MKVKFETRGFRELDRKLAKIAKSLPKAKQLEILADAGEIIAEEARQLVPVDDGILRESISVSDDTLGGAFKMDATLRGKGAVVYIGPRTRSGPPDGFYGHMVEYGTVHMSAQPFMRPAFDRTQGQVLSRIAGDVAAEIRRAGRS